MTEVRHLRARISAAKAGLRLDQALAQLFPEYSRSSLKSWIENGQVTLNTRPCRPRDSVFEGDEVSLTAELNASDELVPEAVQFDVVHEDSDCIVVDKPAGCVVHPGAGNASGTLANGLIHRYPELDALPRAGLIHRLDKDTSGLLIVARTSGAFQALTKAMAAREITRIYCALANGLFITGGSVDEPIGRDPSNRQRMRVRSGGREAITHYRIEAKFRAHTQLEVRLETGRTHQIRVHLAHIGHPLIGDKRYGARLKLPRNPTVGLDGCLRRFLRPALHAKHLEFAHPRSEKRIKLESVMPLDLAQLSRELADDAASESN